MNGIGLSSDVKGVKGGGVDKDSVEATIGARKGVYTS